ncbi:MAG: FAD-binding oxidoreductase [Thiolinea sp.]
MHNQDFLQQVKQIVGDKYVLVNDDARERYEEDATGFYKGQSLAIVRPASTAEVSAVVKLAHAAQIPVVPIAGNTGLNGGAWPGTDRTQILLSVERLNRVREIKPDSRIIIAEAGVILDNMHQAADEHDLTFPLTFGARGSCMLGGNLSTNAGGSNVVRYGNTRELCLGLEVVLADGQVMNLMSELRKDNTGYDLKDLFIGAEGTLGIITAAVMKLYPKPKAYATAMIALRDVSGALTLLNRLQAVTNNSVEAFEYMPKNYMRRLLERFPEMQSPFDELAEVAVLLEIGATSADDARLEEDGSLPVVNKLEATLAELFESGLVLDAVVAQNETQRKAMWAQREAAYEVMIMKPSLIMTDVSVPLDQVQNFLQRMAQSLPAAIPQAEEVIVAHLGDGNVHYSVWSDPEGHKTEEEHKQQKTVVVELVEEAVLALGGSFSAEHGIGVYKKPSMARRKDPVALSVMRAVKQALDPLNILNPGKMLPD